MECRTVRLAQRMKIAIPNIIQASLANLISLLVLPSLLKKKMIDCQGINP